MGRMIFLPTVSTYHSTEVLLLY